MCYSWSGKGGKWWLAGRRSASHATERRRWEGHFRQCPSSACEVQEQSHYYREVLMSVIRTSVPLWTIPPLQQLFLPVHCTHAGKLSQKYYVNVMWYKEIFLQFFSANTSTSRFKTKNNPFYVFSLNFVLEAAFSKIILSTAFNILFDLNLANTRRVSDGTLDNVGPTNFHPQRVRFERDSRGRCTYIHYIFIASSLSSVTRINKSYLLIFRKGTEQTMK